MPSLMKRGLYATARLYINGDYYGRSLVLPGLDAEYPGISTAEASVLACSVCSNRFTISLFCIPR